MNRFIWCLFIGFAGCDDKDDEPDDKDSDNEEQYQVQDSDEESEGKCPELRGVHLQTVLSPTDLDVLGVVAFYQGWLRSQAVASLTPLDGTHPLPACWTISAQDSESISFLATCDDVAGTARVWAETQGELGGGTSFFHDVDLEIHGFGVEVDGAPLLLDMGQKRIGIGGVVTVTAPSGGTTALTPDATEGVVAWTWLDDYEGESDQPCTGGEQEAQAWTRVLLLGQGEGGRAYDALDCDAQDRLELLTGFEHAATDEPVLLEFATLDTDLGPLQVPLAVEVPLTATFEVDPGPGLPAVTEDDLSSLPRSYEQLMEACAADTACASRATELGLGADCVLEGSTTVSVRQSSAVFSEGTSGG